MDLLDSFGDWIQFIGCIIGLGFFPINNQFNKHYNSFTYITVFFILINIIIPLLLYYYVFDYDLIFGLCLGSIYSIWINISNIKHYKLDDNIHRRRQTILSIIIMIIILVIMLYKIIRYIL